MATYAIGDIQGCFDELERLLGLIAFAPSRDRLWLSGDLVNRGPRSLEVLRWARGLGDRAVTVLGNHDLHLLARAEGVRRHKKRDTLDEVLAAPDRDDLITWLRERPLLHVEGPWTLVHAGLAPQWTLADAMSWAERVSATLRGPQGSALLGAKSGRRPRWRDAMPPFEREVLALHLFTRLRICTAEGEADLGFAAHPREAPAGYFPWFSCPGRRWSSGTIVFAHWAALGLHVSKEAVGLDSGCVWGGALTAMRLEDRKVFQVPCPGAAQDPPDEAPFAGTARVRRPGSR